MPDMSTDLTVIERSTGELVDIKAASTLSLAAWITDRQAEREQLATAEQIVSDEIISRMDQQACWTLREGDLRDGEAWEIKAASPAAGTETYPPDLLEQALNTLITAGLINEQAAEAALRRTVNIEVTVPWGSDPDKITATLGQSIEVEIAGHKTVVQAANANRKIVASGINKLRKILGTKETLDGVVVKSDPPKRRVKVTLKTKG